MTWETRKRLEPGEEWWDLLLPVMARTNSAKRPVRYDIMTGLTATVHGEAIRLLSRAGRRLANRGGRRKGMTISVEFLVPLLDYSGI